MYKPHSQAPWKMGALRTHCCTDWERGCRRAYLFFSDLSCSAAMQDQVNRAPYFAEVFQMFTEWLESRELSTKYKFAVVTDWWAEKERELANFVSLVPSLHTPSFYHTENNQSLECERVGTRLIFCMFSVSWSFMFGTSSLEGSGDKVVTMLVDIHVVHLNTLFTS